MTATIATPDTAGADAPRQTPRHVTFKLSASLAVLLLAAAIVMVVSLALFTDTASVGGNTFTTGTIDIDAAPASAAVTLAAMVPGDQATAPITVSNTGSLDLRYAVESTTTENVLAAELVLTVKAGVSSCTDASWASTGTTLYSGRLGSVSGDAVIGSADPGADAGDRTLAPSASEVLCVNVTLPLASTAGQGLTTTATFDFLAEQTANNP